MDKRIITPIEIKGETFNEDIEKADLPIPEEYKDDTNEEAAIKYGIK